MEEENASAAITDRDFLNLLQAAKQKEQDAMQRIIELFQEDIEKISRTIRMPREDAVSHIILELLEYIQTESTKG